MIKGFFASPRHSAEDACGASPGLSRRFATAAQPMAAHQTNKGATMRGRGLILAGLMAASMSLGLPASSLAQDTTGQSPGSQIPGGPSAGDPPSRVGRVAEVSGTVSFHTSDESQWQAATLNYPVTSGNSFWTEPRSHAALELGPSRIYLDSSTELDIGTLNDQGFVASMPQGALYLQVADPAGSAPLEIDTPRGQVHINQPGRYEIVAGDADHPTTVTAYDGGAQVTGPGVNLSLGPQQAAAITGQNQNDLQVATGQAQQPDDFVQLVQSQEQPNQPNQGQPQQGAAPYASPEMTGAQDLNQYGSWQSTPDYGQVWYPQVSADWAPYRYGHWAYVAPWGWTWVDDSPWGFAPFHYGRWVDYGGRWGWAPGPYDPYPVYAPALVSFFGDFGGIGVGISIGFGDVGWVPLGWGEPYYPGYGVSEHCFQQLNIAFVNRTTINNYYNDYRSGHHDGFDHYRNHEHGATMVSADDMQHSRSIGQAWHKHPQGSSNQAWTQAKSWGGQAPVKPSLATAGLTPNAAHQLGLKGQPGGLQQHRSPGPSFASRGSTTGGFAGSGRPIGGVAAGGNQTQNHGQFFANGQSNNKANGNLLAPNAGQTHGQVFANAPANQALFGQLQTGKKPTGFGQNNGLVGHYTQTPPLLGSTSHGTNGIGNWQNNAGSTSQARNYFQQQPQKTNGSRNLQNNAGSTNQARNYFQQPTHTTNGSGNWQGNTNQARNYFQQPTQKTNGSGNWQGNTNQARNYFQQPTQNTNGSGNWQGNTSQARNYFQQPTQKTNGLGNWQGNTNQSRNYSQQPTQRSNQTFGQGNAYFQQQPQQQRNFVSNNFQGGNAFSRQQVQQPRNNQPQAPTGFKKKTNNGG